MGLVARLQGSDHAGPKGHPVILTAWQAFGLAVVCNLLFFGYCWEMRRRGY